MKKNQRKLEIPPNILAIVSVALTALVLILVFKFKGGILGIVLGTVAVAALIYWLREMKKIFGEEKAYPTSEPEWFYDLIDDGEGVTIIAKVPGPSEKIRVKLLKGVLEIRGGEDFTRRVRVLDKVELKDKSYINGVLHVRLEKPKKGLEAT